MITPGKTSRGFDLFVFEDLNSKVCSLQKSSVMGVEAIWLGISRAEPKILASQAGMFGVRTSQTTGWVDLSLPREVEIGTRMHLTQDQVAELLPILQRFVETGELSDC